MSKILPRAFYERPVVEVARALIGKQLVHQVNGHRIAGIILESEAYDGEQDLACHAHSGKTRRNAVMYGPAGHAYIYFTYGMHWLFNCVTGSAEYPAAVLVRALHPTAGLELIEQNRTGIQQKLWCNGPAKLTKALAINGELNGSDLCQKNTSLWIEEGVTISEESVEAIPRVGIDYAGEPWISKPWRFLVQMEALKIDALIQ